jgi:hypothetical protein
MRDGAAAPAGSVAPFMANTYYYYLIVLTTTT